MIREFFLRKRIEERFGFKLNKKSKLALKIFRKEVELIANKYGLTMSYMLDGSQPDSLERFRAFNEMSLKSNNCLQSLNVHESTIRWSTWLELYGYAKKLP
jgi:hypothetical protein